MCLDWLCDDEKYRVDYGSSREAPTLVLVHQRGRDYSSHLCHNPVVTDCYVHCQKSFS